MVSSLASCLEIVYEGANFIHGLAQTAECTAEWTIRVGPDRRKSVTGGRVFEDCIFFLRLLFFCQGLTICCPDCP